MVRPRRENAGGKAPRALDPSSTLGVSRQPDFARRPSRMANMAVRRSHVRGYMDELALCDSGIFLPRRSADRSSPTPKPGPCFSKSRKKFASVDA